MRRVLVFGATSAIAAALCRRWAARGDRLHLIGRDPEKLAAVAEACGGAVTTEAADLEDVARASARVEAGLAALGGAADLVLIAHGDIGDQLLSERDLAEAERIVRVNFTSAVALLIPIAEHLERRRSGQIAVLGSVAGERGRPRNYTYGASKGALRLYLQGLRSRLEPAGVRVTTVRLGPVDTPMTATHPKNAFFASLERAARDADRAIARGAREPFVPWFWRPIMAFVRSAPEALFQRLRALSGR